MKLTRVQLSFIAVLGAGALLLAGTFLLPSAKTYGSETDQAVQLPDGMTTDSFGSAPVQGVAPSSQAPSQAPAPPQAPVEKPSDSTTTGGAGTGTAPSPATGAVGAGTVQLPSTGDGSALSASTETMLSYLLMGLGLAMLATGSMVWVYGRRSR